MVMHSAEKKHSSIGCYLLGLVRTGVNRAPDHPEEILKEVFSSLKQLKLTGQIGSLEYCSKTCT